jgi:hypothetical protein
MVFFRNCFKWHIGTISNFNSLHSSLFSWLNRIWDVYFQRSRDNWNEIFSLNYNWLLILGWNIETFIDLNDFRFWFLRFWWLNFVIEYTFVTLRYDRSWNIMSFSYIECVYLSFRIWNNNIFASCIFINLNWNIFSSINSNSFVNSSSKWLV